MYQYPTANTTPQTQIQQKQLTIAEQQLQEPLSQPDLQLYQDRNTLTNLQYSFSPRQQVSMPQQYYTTEQSNNVYKIIAQSQDLSQQQMVLPPQVYEGQTVYEQQQIEVRPPQLQLQRAVSDNQAYQKVIITKQQQQQQQMQPASVEPQIQYVIQEPGMSGAGYKEVEIITEPVIQYVQPEQQLESISMGKVGQPQQMVIRKSYTQQILPGQGQQPGQAQYQIIQSQDTPKQIIVEEGELVSPKRTQRVVTYQATGASSEQGPVINPMSSSQVLVKGARIEGQEVVHEVKYYNAPESGRLKEENERLKQ